MEGTMSSTNQYHEEKSRRGTVQDQRRLKSLTIKRNSCSCSDPTNFGNNQGNQKVNLVSLISGYCYKSLDIKYHVYV